MQSTISLKREEKKNTISLKRVAVPNVSGAVRSCVPRPVGFTAAACKSHPWLDSSRPEQQTTQTGQRHRRRSNNPLPARLTTKLTLQWRARAPPNPGSSQARDSFRATSISIPQRWCGVASPVSPPLPLCLSRVVYSCAPTRQEEEESTEVEFLAAVPWVILGARVAEVRVRFVFSLGPLLQVEPQ